MCETPEAKDTFSFEVAKEDKLSSNVEDASYQTLLVRLGVGKQAEKILRPDLLNFNCYVVSNIEWYYTQLKRDYWTRKIWFVISAFITLAIPLIVYLVEETLRSSNLSMASALLASLFAWHRTVNTYLSKNRVATGYRASVSSLKELLYEFENKWSGKLSSYAHARVFVDDFTDDLKKTIIEARKVVAKEKIDYFENNKPTLISLLNNQLPQQPTEARSEFLSDSMTQPTANFRFPGFTPEEEEAVLSAHLIAFQTIQSCTKISDIEKSKLRETYIRPIRHLKITGSDYGQAELNGSFIGINLQKLMDPTVASNELPQTLIHEMMHCAGYCHPDKDASDVPGDGGDYFNSPPLRAELCIAGLQSDNSGGVRSSRPNPTCSRDPTDGSFKIV